MHKQEVVLVTDRIARSSLMVYHNDVAGGT